MDKIKWMLDMAEKQQDDARTWFWLGQAYGEQYRWLDAIGAYSKGLGVCHSDGLRQELLSALSGATSALQGSTVSNQMGTEDELEQPESNRPDKNEKDAPQLVKPLHGHPGLRVIDGGKSESLVTQNASVPSISFKDVAGLQELKKTIQIRIISPFYNQGLFSKFRKKTGGGVLLYGPPGCGKTFMASATAGECRAKFIPVHITDILDPYLGVSEQNLKDFFDQARSHKPSIMFFDEMDALGFNRSKSSGHLRGLVDTFLSEMEGIDTNTEQVLIMGATNMPWDVDNALKRPGRFDRLVFVAPPDEEARDLMFQLKMDGRYCEPLDTRRLAKMTEFYSGADIENVCERAAEQVLFEIMESGVERPIYMKDMEEAVALTQPSTMEWFRTAKNYIKYANQSGMNYDLYQYLIKNVKRL
jgi:SpoVK/Ycf46/Vps4 family AAA+-type ATPase